MHIRCGRRRARRAGVGAFMLLGVGLGLNLSGCGSLEPVARYAPITDPTQLYWDLVLDHRAITMSTVPGYDTLQLTATPLDGTLAAMAGLPAPTFTAKDPTVVEVTPDGRLQARHAGSSWVVATLTTPGNVRHADSAWVKVNATTDPPPTLGSLSLAPPDSAIRPYWIYYGLDVYATRVAPFKYAKWNMVATVKDIGGNVISGISVEYRSLDSAVAYFNVGNFPVSTLISSAGGIEVRPYSPGQVRMVARATVYGVTQEDTVTYTVTWPIVSEVDLGPSSWGSILGPVIPSEVRIAPYGVVSWLNFYHDSVDITFDDPTNVAMPPAAVCDRLTRLHAFDGGQPHCGIGSFIARGIPPGDSTVNLPEFWTVQVRQFPVPGVYTYHSTRKGISGRVVVTNDPDPMALP